MARLSVEQYAGRLDPPLTDRCPTCKTRREPFKHLARGHVDPFCSTVCCKSWFAVPIDLGTPSHEEGGRVAAERYRRGPNYRETVKRVAG